MAILFFLHHVNYAIAGKNKIRACVKDILTDHNKKIGAINIILTGDKDLLGINKKYLKRDYLTDIITFNFNEVEVISGDLFISIERIKENAGLYNVNIESELLRVIIHGILHLTGYKDERKTDKKRMSKMEDLYIKRYYKKRSDNL